MVAARAVLKVALKVDSWAVPPAVWRAVRRVASMAVAMAVN